MRSPSEADDFKCTNSRSRGDIAAGVRCGNRPQLKQLYEGREFLYRLGKELAD